MTYVFLYALASVVVVSLLSLLGVFTLSLRERVLKSVVFVLVSMSAGALFGDAFIHLIPESFKRANSEVMAVVIVSGILVFFALEKFLAWRHRHGADEESSETLEYHEHPSGHLGVLVITADAVHNFIDGVIIAASYLVSIEVGLTTTIAVILHEIPQEIARFGLLIHAGYSRGNALFLNFLSAVVAIAGLVLVFLVGSTITRFIPSTLAFAAGGFIYIAGSDLVPEIHKTQEVKRSLIQFLSMIVGVTLMVALLYIE